ncbi:unnamed protein product [Echinostoma caproni]|uniref:Retrotrans_gag domain-containing protein n=1 Tax=Echinostoma caproni TaxID=27848 RepID=A0A183A131_9TREM|nr:unnamed protein product [Echinostoma caproni]
MASLAGSTKKQNGKDKEEKPERAEEMNLGGNYARWEVQARAYVQKFPESERKVAISGLLAVEAADRAFQSSAFEEEDLDGVFRKLRCLLDTPLHPIEYQSQLHSARQNIGKTVEAYAYRVKQLVSKAFPDDNSEAQDKLAVERFVEGFSGALDVSSENQSGDPGDQGLNKDRLVVDAVTTTIDDDGVLEAMTRPLPGGKTTREAPHTRWPGATQRTTVSILFLLCIPLMKI